MMLSVLTKGMEMNKQTIVVFDKTTKEIIACIPLSDGQTICRKDVDIKIYNGTEPVFTEMENMVILNENAFMLNMRTT